MVAAVFNDNEDLTTFLDQFDDLQDVEDPSIGDNLNDLFPAIWTEEEPTSELDHSALQEAQITEARCDGDKLCLSANNQLRSASPISVLNDNASSGLSAKLAKTMLSDVPVAVQGRARTRRCLQPTVNHTPSGHQLVPASWTWTTTLDSTQKPAMERRKKNKKFKLASPSEMDRNKNKNPNSAPLQVWTERKCTHCEITNTPQWRLGPMGPKTLCNACGVRYKSGRLFPEYRPAASPTFSPSKHSNSHRKVLEMREKDGKSAPVMDVVKVVEGEENHLVSVSVELIADGFRWA